MTIHPQWHYISSILMGDANQKNIHMETKVIIGLTDMEKQVLNAMSELMYAEWGFSDVGATEISQNTNIEMKAIRGVIASLVKKGLIEAYDRSDEIGYVKNDPSWEPILYLRGDAEALVKHWQDEIGFISVIE